jgi:hypothetical protein
MLRRRNEIKHDDYHPDGISVWLVPLAGWANDAHQPPRAKDIQHVTETLSRGQAACAGWAAFC